MGRPKKNQRALLARYMREAQKFNDSDLYKQWEGLSIAIQHFHHSAKDCLAMEVCGNELIERNLYTLKELRSLFKKIGEK
ncbi:MAG: hypothetical protein QNK51_01555 [Chitinophagales bacterium]